MPWRMASRQEACQGKPRKPPKPPAGFFLGFPGFFVPRRLPPPGGRRASELHRDPGDRRGRTWPARAGSTALRPDVRAEQNLLHPYRRSFLSSSPDPARDMIRSSPPMLKIEAPGVLCAGGFDFQTAGSRGIIPLAGCRGSSPAGVQGATPPARRRPSLNMGCLGSPAGFSAITLFCDVIPDDLIVDGHSCL